MTTDVQASLSLADSLAVDEQYSEAIDAYAAALSLLAESTKEEHRHWHVRVLSHRSSAFYNLNRFQEALEDANAALHIMSTHHPANLRPGEGEIVHKRVALAAFSLAHYEAAKQAFQQASQLAILNSRDDSIYKEWIIKCDTAHLSPSTRTTSESNSNTPPPMPIEAASAPPSSTKVPPVASQSNESRKPSTATHANTSHASTLRPQMPKYQYYQSDTVMTISILEANVQPSDLRVQFEPQRLTVQLTKGGVDFTVIAGTLYSEIIVDRCKIVYKGEKVLLKLRKKDSYEWHELFGKATIPAMDKPRTTASITTTNDNNNINNNNNNNNNSSATLESTKQPSQQVKSAKDTTKVRPYASHKDWDAIERDVIMEEETNEKPVGDEAMNKLFQQIYANASEDTKRAMIKSYQTSGGTVLSTNWDEVKKKDYEKERTAPKGMEWKTWEGDKVPMQDDD